MKTKLILSLLVVTMITSIKAFGQGIEFFDGTWEQTLNKAKQENKLIFIDFYTEWCGPCLNMAENVFVLPTVGDYYNNNFINAKIDAEKGEGITLAKKYGVKSYPSYMYIDPTTEEAVHASSSRQSAEQFIYTGQSANIPKQRSSFLNENYEKGNQETDFLIDFINYHSTVYNRKMVNEAFDKLIAKGEKLTDPNIWSVFEDKILGYDNVYIQDISDNYDTYFNLFGKEVDEKLKKETTYMPIDKLNALHDFEGKDFNKKMIAVNQFIRDKKYDDAANLIDTLLKDPNVDKDEMVNRLEFIARAGLYQKESKEWFDKCLSYTRYVAYNKTDRKDPYIHQAYAGALEKLIQQFLDGEEKEFPSFLGNEPEYGKSEYTMRPDNLKSKPVKK